MGLLASRTEASRKGLNATSPQPMATVYTGDLIHGKKVISALDVAADIVGEENEFRDVRDLSNDELSDCR